MPRFAPASLQARLALLVVLLFLGSLWSFAVVLAERQEARLRDLLATQQFATVGYVADDVENKLRLRIDALERVAALVPTAPLHDRRAMTDWLANRPILASLFDAGVIVVRPDGRGAFANYPPVAAQQEMDFSRLPAIAAVMASGRPAVGRPMVGPTARRPVVAFAVPVTGGGGLAGMLVGVTSINAPNFLDLVSKPRYGSGGELLVVAPEHGIFVAGSDPAYTLKPLPARTPMLDRARAGFEGTDLTPSHDGVERLVSIKRVPTAGWYVVARIPAAEVLAPVTELRRLIFGGATLLSLVIGLLAASLIRRALAPLVGAAGRLDDISQGRAPLQPLPVGRDDEVGRLLGSFNRLQERLQAESESLRRSQRQFAVAFRASPVAASIARAADGRFMEINERYERDLGWTQADLLGRTSVEVGLWADPADRQPWVEALERQGTVVDWETTWRDKQGQPRRVSISAELIELEGEACILAFIADVTARRQAEEQLEHERAYLRTLVGTIPDLVWLKDPDGIYLTANPVVERFMGLPAGGMLGKTDYDLFDRPLADFLRQKDLEAAAAGAPQATVERVSRPDGGFAWLETIKTPMVDGAGKLVGVLGIARDVTEAHRYQEALAEGEERLRTLINAMPDIVCFKDGEGRWLEANDFDVKLFQLEGVDYRGKKDSELAAYQDFYRQSFLGCEASDELAWRAGGMSRGIEVIPRPDGPAMTFDIIKVPLFHPDGRRRGLVVVGRDISEATRAAHGLKLAASVFEHTHEGITIADAAGNIVEVNGAFSRITGYDRDEVLGHNPRLLKSGRHGADFYTAMWRAITTAGYWRGEIWNRRKNGEVYPELLTISAVRDDSGVVSHYVAVFADISLLKQHEQQLERIAHYDALTAIPNRVLLADRMRQAIAQTRRLDTLLAVCYLDLDGFKPINDQHGHEAGDRLLVEMARRLKGCLRGGDTVARLGGDEFVLLLLGLGHVDEAEAALRRILDAVAQPFAVAGHLVGISASIGVTLYPLDDADPDTLLRHADQAMYLAKQAGRNRHHVFDPEHDRRTRAHREALGRIEAALRDGEFVLHYQPKVNMRLGRVVGAEALIRWQHPERGLLPPGEFLPDIEDTDLIIDLGDWVMEAALAQMSAWRAEGLDLAVSVNVAARHLQQDNFVPRLKALLARHADIPAGALELEVLETAALEDMGRVSRVIDDCRALGVAFALDDFGTGYSSLTYFKALRADTLKIDQSFIRDMLRDPEDLAIVEGVIGLTKVFNRQVIAEGVETIDHGLLLLSLGCELAQGYGIARPMAADAIPAWVAAWEPDAAWMTAAGFQWARADLPLVAAESDHRHWVDDLAAFLIGEAAGLSPPADAGHCRFGDWYRGAGRDRYGHLAEFTAIDDRHARIHALGAELAALCAAGRRDEARSRLPELLRLRDDLLDDLRGLMAMVMMGG